MVTDTCVATCGFLCGRCGFELKSPCLFNKCSYLIRRPLSPYFCSLTAHSLVSLVILRCLDIFKFICAGKVCLFKNTFTSKFGSLDKAPLKSLRTLLTPTYTQTDAAALSQAMHCPHLCLAVLHSDSQHPTSPSSSADWRDTWGFLNGEMRVFKLSFLVLRMGTILQRRELGSMVPQRMV